MLGLGRLTRSAGTVTTRPVRTARRSRQPAIFESARANSPLNSPTGTTSMSGSRRTISSIATFGQIRVRIGEDRAAPASAINWPMNVLRTSGHRRIVVDDVEHGRDGCAGDDARTLSSVARTDVATAVAAESWPVSRPMLAMPRKMSVVSSVRRMNTGMPSGRSFCANLLALVALPGDHEIRVQIRPSLRRSDRFRRRPKASRRPPVRRRSACARRSASSRRWRSSVSSRARNERDDALRGMRERHGESRVVDDTDRFRCTHGVGTRACVRARTVARSRARVASAGESARGECQARHRGDKPTSCCGGEKHNPVLAHGESEDGG